MTARYCPLKLITSGIIPGEGQDAQSHNRALQCRTDCMWWQHESCAIANAAGALWGILQLLNRLTTTEQPQAEEVGDDDAPVERNS